VFALAGTLSLSLPGGFVMHSLAFGLFFLSGVLFIRLTQSLDGRGRDRLARRRSSHEP